MTPRGGADVLLRGEWLFHDPVIGCAGCHSGAQFTDNRTLDVGTGGHFQVPPLTGVARRAPWMHDGCAETLAARFTDETCGGGDAHGVTSHLSQDDIGALVVFLESL